MHPLETLPYFSGLLIHLIVPSHPVHFLFHVWAMFDSVFFWIVVLAAMAFAGLVSWIVAGVVQRRDLLDAQKRAAYAEAQLAGMDDQLQAREQALEEVRGQASDLHAQNSGLQARLQAQKEQVEQQAKTLSDVRAELEREMKLLRELRSSYRWCAVEEAGGMSRGNALISRG